MVSACDEKSAGNNTDSIKETAAANSNLANEAIEQEAEESGHTNSGEIHVKDATEPAPPGQPKSIANNERS